MVGYIPQPGDDHPFINTGTYSVGTYSTSRATWRCESIKAADDTATASVRGVTYTFTLNPPEFTKVWESCSTPSPRTTRRAYTLAPRTPRLVVLLAVLAVLLAVTFLMPFKAYGQP